LALRAFKNLPIADQIITLLGLSVLFVTAILSSAKIDKLENVSISLIDSKSLCIVDRYWKMAYF